MTQNTPSPFIPAAHINKSVMIRRKKHEDICLFVYRPTLLNWCASLASVKGWNDYAHASSYNSRERRSARRGATLHTWPRPHIWLWIQWSASTNAANKAPADAEKGWHSSLSAFWQRMLYWGGLGIRRYMARLPRCRPAWFEPTVWWFRRARKHNNFTVSKIYIYLCSFLRPMLLFSYLA